MALKTGLAIHCYTLPQNTPPVVVDYSHELMGLNFTTLAPGGYGQLTAILQLKDARIPRPELAMFSRVALLSGHVCLFLGEITDPESGLDDQDGEYVSITALGIGNSLRDDPQTVTYTNQTPPAVARDQLARRAAYLPVDQDDSQLFPDNPTGTFAATYNNRNMEEVLADQATLASYIPNGSTTAVTYQWGTWAHPTHTDAAGFPMGQVQIHQQDTTTTHYMASLAEGDITAYKVTPSAERAYNVISITYKDPTSGNIATATWKDARLNSDGSQGGAPFRRRVYQRDLSTVATVTAAQAQQIANTYGAQFSNPTNKVDITLINVRDGNGNPIPLFMPLADHNVYVPELAVRGQSLPLTPKAGVNQFYIVQTSYTEDASGTQTLEIQADNYVDTASLQIARLQLWADGIMRSASTTGTVQTPGASEVGGCGAQLYFSAVGQQLSVWVGFRSIMTKTPSSISLAANSNGYVSSITASNISTTGFTLTLTGGQIGACYWFGTYTTVGNCLLAVDSEAGTFDWHCDRCDQVCAGLSLHTDMHTSVLMGSTPGLSQLTVICPHCGGIESFNTGLDPADEAHAGNAFRAQQATLIRAAMAHEANALPLAGRANDVAPQNGGAVPAPDSVAPTLSSATHMTATTGTSPTTTASEGAQPAG